MSADEMRGREVIFEFTVIGYIVKVSAVDVKTLTEISIQGPVSAGEEVLKSAALKKLVYVLRKKGVLT